MMGKTDLTADAYRQQSMALVPRATPGWKSCAAWNIMNHHSPGAMRLSSATAGAGQQSCLARRGERLCAGPGNARPRAGSDIACALPGSAPPNSAR